MTNTRSRSTKTAGSIGRAAVVLLLMFVALGSWAVSSPAGSSPDDDFHLASIWCGLGDREGLCESTSTPGERLVPQLTRDAPVCYATKPAVSASCQEDISDPDALVATSRVNSEGLYPPVYYAVTGVFASTNVEASVVVIRLVNVAIFLGVTALLYFLLPPRRRSTLAWSWSIAIVPLGMFLIASNNPSAWAIISGGTVWLALVGYFESHGRRQLALAAVALIAVCLGAGSRADSALYTVLGAFVAVALTFRKDLRYALLALLPIASIVIAVTLFLTSNQAASASGGLGTGTQATSPDIGYLLTINLLDVPLLWAGVFGSWQLGWFDTPMPGVVSVGALAAFCVVAFTGLAHTSWRKLLVLGVIVSALVAIPVYILVKSNTRVGGEVQPRYILPLIVIFGGVALFHLGQRTPQMGRVQTLLVEITLIIANSVALHENIRRYITGVDMGGWNLNTSVEWWWPGLPSPMAIWVIGSVAFAVALHLLFVFHSEAIFRVTPWGRLRRRAQAHTVEAT